MKDDAKLETERTKMETIIHADDFGITVPQSYRILSCSSACGGSGPLNSTSVLVGSPHVQKCAELIKPFANDKKIHVGLHINLVEGPCCANAKDIPDLVDARGMLSLSFTQLLRRGNSVKASGNSAHFYDQIYTEVRAQLEKFFELFPQSKDALRIDTHQHTIMIPAVMQATLNAIKDTGATLEYMRIPTEPLLPYASALGNWKNYPAINFVKNGILNSLMKPCKRIIESHFDMSARDFMDKYSATFYGLVLSGRMEYACSPAMFKKFERASKLQRTEILFHPGACERASECLNPAATEFVTFYLSSHRNAECEALQNCSE